MMKLFLHDTHTYLVITITAIIAMLFNVLGVIPTFIVYTLLIAYGVIFFLLNIRKKSILTKPIFFIMVAYYLYFLFAVSLNGTIWQTGFAIIQLFLISLISYFIKPNEEIESDIEIAAKIMTIASLIMVISSLAVTLFTYTHIELVNTLPEIIKSRLIKVTGSFPRRMAGFHYHPNKTAEFCMTGSLFSSFLFIKSSKKEWKIFSMLNILLSFYTIFVLTNSRTAMVGYVGSIGAFFLLYLFLLNKDKKRKLVFTIVFITIVILLALILLFSESFSSFVFNNVLRVSSLSTASGRDSVYKVAFELGKGHRLFGYNINLLEEAIAPHAHNIYLQLLSFAGAPGLILFCLYFFYTSVIAVKNIFDRRFTETEKKLNCFLACYIFCYFLVGIPEIAGVDSYNAISIHIQIVLAYVNLLHYNVKNQEFVEPKN